MYIYIYIPIPSHIPKIISIKPNDIPIKPNNIPIKPNDIPIEPNCIPIKPNNIPIKPNDIPIEPNDIPIKPNDIPINVIKSCCFWFSHHITPTAHHSNGVLPGQATLLHVASSTCETGKKNVDHGDNHHHYIDYIIPMKLWDRYRLYKVVIYLCLPTIN